MTPERLQVERHIAATPQRIFQLLCQPAGHVSIDASGMLQSAQGPPVAEVGDEFVVHMHREALNDHPLGRYDVTVRITRFEPDVLIEWTIKAFDRDIGHHYGYRLAPQDNETLVTSYYDWSKIESTPQRDSTFPVVPEFALRATLGILARTVESPHPG